MEKKIILTTKGNISAADKEHLRKHGVVIAEVENIGKVKIVSNADHFDMDDITISAIQAVKDSSYDSTRNQFAVKLLAKIINKPPHDPHPSK